MFQVATLAMLEDKQLSQITHISMLILVLAQPVATQDSAFIAAQIRLQVMLVPSLIPMDQCVQVTSMI